ncbi:hypothetical protein ACLBW8_03040 [Pseudomonas sp. M5A4_2d]
MLNLSLDQFIATSASVAAGVSALATFLTVFQIWIQRKSSYKPEIIFSKTNFNIASENNSNSSDGMLHARLSVKAYNIGLGPAKDLTVRWSFPIDVAVAKVNSLATAGIKMDKYFIKDDVLSTAEDSARSMTSMWVSQKEQKIDFALPASISDQPILIGIPHAYSTLWLSYVINSLQMKGSLAKEDFPPLTATITFQDIGGSKYKVRQRFLVGFIYYVQGEKGLAGQIASKSY